MRVSRHNTNPDLRVSRERFYNTGPLINISLNASKNEKEPFKFNGMQKSGPVSYTLALIPIEPSR